MQGSKVIAFAVTNLRGVLVVVVALTTWCLC